MYELHRDRSRVLAFRRAIHKAVKKNDIVLDVGTGTGILSLFALEAGAKRVWSVERSSIAWQAREIFQLNIKDQNRIRLIQGDIDKAYLPEKADVLLTEMFSNLGYEEYIVEVIQAARKNLKEKATYIPKRLWLRFSPVFSSEWASRQKLWKNYYGYDFSPMANKDLHKWHIIENSKNIIFLSNSLNSFHYNFSSPKKLSFPWTEDFEFIIKRKGIINGLAGWFESELTNNVFLDSKKCRHWNLKFFPVSHPQPVHPGDKVITHISFSSQWNPDWQIEVWRGKKLISETSASSILGHIQKARRTQSGKLVLQQKQIDSYD